MNILKVNTKDIIFTSLIIIALCPFFLSPNVYLFYMDFNSEHGFITSFIKFSILATLGEVIGLRISSGVYNQPNFGIIPRAIVWGVIGVTIKIAFIIFATGTPQLLNYIGIEIHTNNEVNYFTVHQLLTAFCISLGINIIYAPIMMTMHKITDLHIINTGGTIRGLFTPIQFPDILSSINWHVQWNFVFLRTIPFFWIPTHTITFLLPTDMQILFSAFLGVVLGVILAIAKSR